MNKIIITNNSLVFEKYNGKIETVYLSEHSYLETMECVRGMVHVGHKLLTHPLSGSLKPNETAFKSIVVSKDKEDLDFNGISIIEEGVASAKKFISGKPTPKYIQRILDDFRLIDLSLIENAINRM